ncbi:protein kinase domain-containing protein [Stenotrophomonas mori]|uniref:Protein kinase n=1 Tax=Stenotrophomonas mori TaxID=2871096 RepID=A0ABT0SH91_9GAMM|nr:protein kinase [Stenotrophomonas mori]MCL7714699.1 protein kinase [Stenotrophomonas mori]
MLTPERWRRLEDLFHRASALAVADREAFVQAETLHDAGLRRELLAMLAVEAEATVRVRGPLQRAVSEIGRVPPPVLPPGTRCGPWAVDALIGSGGMGRVYRGHRADGAYQQQVAIKMIANPGLDERSQAHFEFECRMQAQMQHPAIAQIHDAGVEGGERPYLVMEYIDGQGIERWCAQQRAPLAQRVRLMMQVCQGVQHAHQKGVIHRDLKPSNVLVGSLDGVPQPKVIDFGIALAGDPAAGERTSGGTPGYMSPEQSGMDIDARSDVYSLGAMLHELLCGQRPPSRPPQPLSPLRAFLALDADAQQRLAGACRCSRRALRRALSDGLDAIVRRATDPRRSQRYDSASALLADLDRWQRQVPPLVVRHQRALVVRKYLQRHRLPAVLATLMLGCVVVGLGASLWSLRQAREQQAVARLRQQQLERMVAFQQDMLQSVDVDAMGHALAAAQARAVPAPDIARDLLERYVVAHALERLQHGVAADAGLSADLRQSLAQVLVAIGRYPAAVRELQAVLAVRRAQQPGQPPVASALAELADARHRQGELGAARELLDEALSLHGAATADDPLWLRVGTLHARVMAAQGGLAAALQHQQALADAWAVRLERDAPALLELELDIVTTLSGLTRREEALRRMEALLPRFRAGFGDDAPRTLAAMLLLARLRNTFNEYEDSLALAGEVRRRRERSLGALHPDTLSATALQGYNMVRLAQAEPAFTEVQAFMEQLLADQQQVLGDDHPAVMQSKTELVRVLAKQDDAARFERALQVQRELLAQRRRVLGAEHPDTLFSLSGLASMLADTDYHEEARAMAYAAMEGNQRRMPGDYWLISANWDVVGRMENRAGRLDAAREAHAKALTMRAASRGDLDVHTTESASRLYAVLKRLQDPEAMAGVERRYLRPIVARDPAMLNAAERSVRDEALRALGQGVQRP